MVTLFDQVRTSLRDTKDLGPRRTELVNFLGFIVKEECDGHYFMSLSLIRKSHFDKLLEDMLDPTNHPDPQPIQFQADVKVAESLQRQWRTRIGDMYLSIDETRYQNLRNRGGRLGKVWLEANDSTETVSWRPRSCEQLSQREIKAVFREGQ